MQFLSLGGSDEIGASCHFLSIAGGGLVLDAGADPNAEGVPSLPRYDLIRSLYGADHASHVFVTHAHHDHIGGLPTLVENFPQVHVHLTHATRALVEFMLFASARLQERKYREGSSMHLPLFDAEQLEDTLARFSTHDYEAPFVLQQGHQQVSAEFYSAGHVLGSSGVLIQFSEKGSERRLFYTSDTNTRSQAIIPGGCYPEPPIDILITETTLGADPRAELTTRKAEEHRFCEALQGVIAREGCALVPVFMLGRAQEVLAVIDRFKRQGRLPKNVPVYTAGGLREVSRIYDQTRHDTPRINEEFEVYQVDQRRFPFKQAKILKATHQPSIFVLASGMLFEKTMSNKLAQLLVEEEKHAILMVGFCKEDSPGGRLLQANEQGQDGVILDRQTGMQPLACQVERFRFSGHSTRRELVGLVGHLRPKKTVLVHGETAARAWMAEAIAKACPGTEVLVPEMGQGIEL